MGDGKRTATAIDAYLRGAPWPPTEDEPAAPKRPEPKPAAAATPTGAATTGT
jgi:hypothetical protein